MLKKDSLFAALVYFTLTFILFRHLAYYADNPDTFQYIAIAKKYLHGDWQNAVNGYWSPFISWLLVIPLVILRDSVLAFKILQILIGLFVIIQWQTLIQFTGTSKWLKNILSLAIIPFVLNYALLNLTPDLLFMGVTILAINIFLKGQVIHNRKIAFRAGIAGGIMFLTKAFGLPLFIALSIAVIYFEKSKVQIDKRSIVTLFTPLVLISLVWIAILSMHYHSFTINKSVSFNRHLNMDMLNGKEKLPILGGGLFPVQPGQNSAWESPGEYLQHDDAKADFSEVFSRNILSIYYLDFRRQIGILFLLALVIIIFKKKIKIFEEKWLFVSLITLLLFYFGYSLILVHSRYLWINTWMMMLMTAFFINHLIANKAGKILALSILFVIALKRPVKELLFITDKETSSKQLLSAIIHPLKTINETYAPDLAIHNFVVEVQKMHPHPGTIYSTGNPLFPRDRYAVSNRITESMESVYLGQSENSIQDAPGRNTTDYPCDFMIEYGIVKSDSASAAENFSPFLTENNYGISLYSLKKL